MRVCSDLALSLLCGTSNLLTRDARLDRLKKDWLSILLLEDNVDEPG
jgi:hypothetical protein